MLKKVPGKVLFRIHKTVKAVMNLKIKMERICQLILLPGYYHGLRK